jgi:replicative DNA helicase
MPNPNQQPFSVEAEQSVIGYVIVHPDRYAEIDLESSDFFIQRHSMIWEAIGSLRAQGKGIDFITIADELSRRGKLNEIGGVAALSNFVSYDYSLEVETCAGLIKDNARRRKMIDLAGDIARAAYDQKSDIPTKTGEFIDRISKLAQSKSSAEHWQKYLSELYDDIVYRAEHPTETWGIPTGLSRFDKITGGAQKGESIIISGKPGVGKSMLAMQMGEGMALSEPGAIYSVEMSGKQVTRRSVSAISGVWSSKLKSGKLEDCDWPHITHAIEKLSALPVYMSDATGWTTTALRADLSRLKARYNIGWFVFDYLLLAGDAPNLEQTERTQIISRAIKLICRELFLAGVTVHSMNKAGIEKQRPDQQNLSGSAQVSYDADLICFLTEFVPVATVDGFISSQDQRNMRTLFFAKGRELEDPAKYLHLVKLPNLPRFGDYAPEPNAQRVLPGKGLYK